MSEAFERVFRECLQDVSANIDALDDDAIRLFCGANVQSPIERLFAQAFIARAATFILYDMQPSANVSWMDVASPNTLKIIVSLEAQFSIENYRLDFLLRAARTSKKTLKTTKIAIECDGKAYHHGNANYVARDKARDRVLSEHVDAVLRFTGAELHASAYSCACQALRVAEVKLA